MIYFKDISLSFGEKRLFNGLNLTVTTGSRIGLVGNNGTGKTTLLRVIMGEVEPDNGEVIIPDRKNVTLGYLPQDLVDLKEVKLLRYLKEASGLLALEEAMGDYERQITEISTGTERHRELMSAYDQTMTAFNAREGYAFAAQAKQILRGLGFGEDDFDKNCSDFSGGWKMRIHLSVLLLSRPDILLLDEPTNHLDTESMEWLEGYLQNYQGTIIAVSHDRFFMDKMVEQIAELANARLTIYKGRYSFYLKEKERRQEALRKEIQQQQAEIKRTEAFIERFRYKATKAKQVQSRIKMLDKITRIKDEQAAKAVTIRFPEHTKSGKEVVTVQTLGKSYGDTEVFHDINLTICRGEKIALVGINGAGKSTFSRLISGSEEPSSGVVRWGLNVKMSFFSQESAQNLNYQNSIWEELAGTDSRFNDQEKRNLLGAFLFSGDDIHKGISILSGGEKSRLALLKILLKDANFLILDEPANHLDMKTKELFQDALLKYQGTLLMVSHDRYFLDRLINRVIELRDGGAHEYLGNYSYFIEKRKEAFSEPVKAETKIQLRVDKPPGNDQDQRRQDKRLEAEERNRLYRLRSGLRKDLAALEEAIHRQEELKRTKELLLSEPGTHRNPGQVRLLKQELKMALEELERLYPKWEELVMHLDQLQKGAVPLPN